MRWPRYRLRTLLLVVAVAGVAFGAADLRRRRNHFLRREAGLAVRRRQVLLEARGRDELAAVVRHFADQWRDDARASRSKVARRRSEGLGRYWDRRARSYDAEAALKRSEADALDRRARDYRRAADRPWAAPPAEKSAE
ncbi:MAG TPA: hypothetical protein VG406_29515 [Isosphaeraceae bacterium]|nr:hypothetical protein [Isosphaeraceae bacterium]